MAIKQNSEVKKAFRSLWRAICKLEDSDGFDLYGCAELVLDFDANEDFSGFRKCLEFGMKNPYCAYIEFDICGLGWSNEVVALKKIAALRTRVDRALALEKKRSELKD